MSSIADLQRMKALERDVKSLRDTIQVLEKRLEALETKRRPGRPPKVTSDAGYRQAISGD